MRAFGALLLLILALFSCDNVSRRDLLVGRLGHFDATAPPITGPEAGKGFSKVAGDYIQLHWSFRDGDSLYVIEMAKDSAFTESKTTYKVSAPQTSLRLPAADFDEATFYWRVAANVTDAGIWSSSHVNVFAEAVYVYCPASEACADTGHNGTLNDPLRTINGGMSLAASNGLDTVRVATRGGSSAGYQETVYIAVNKNLRGGYSTDFSSRDAAVHVARIKPSSAQAVFAYNLKKASGIDGFSIEPQAGGAAAVQIQYCNEKLVISNNQITAVQGSTASAIQLDSSSSHILGNTIIVGSSAMASFTGITIDNSSNPLFGNNLINCTQATGTIVCINVDNSSQPRIYNNTIHTGNAPTSITGIAFNNSGAGEVQGNILFSSGNLGNPRLLKEFAASAGPTVVKNNNLFTLDVNSGFRVFVDFDAGCTGNGDADADNTTCTLAEMEGLADITGGASGNVSIDDTTGRLFISGRGAGGDVTSHADNDWHLKTPVDAICNVLFGGINTSGAFPDDHDGTTRTPATTSLGCNLSAPSDTLGEGWSMGAYEKN